MLKHQDRGPILVAGSATLVSSLIEKDLVDELRLMVFPVSSGGGKRVSPESLRKKAFQLADIKAFAMGVAVHTYTPSSGPARGRTLVSKHIDLSSGVDAHRGS